MMPSSGPPWAVSGNGLQNKAASQVGSGADASGHGLYPRGHGAGLGLLAAFLRDWNPCLAQEVAEVNGPVRHPKEVDLEMKWEGWGRASKGRSSCLGRHMCVRTCMRRPLSTGTAVVIGSAAAGESSTAGLADGPGWATGMGVMRLRTGGALPAFIWCALSGVGEQGVNCEKRFNRGRSPQASKPAPWVRKPQEIPFQRIF